MSSPGIRVAVGVLALSLCHSASVGAQKTGTLDPAEPTILPTSTQASPPSAKPSKKKGKVEYTGPNTVVELPPSPILDSEGKQQLDPDAKPMFDPPVRQMRDKKGHPVFDDAGKPVFQTAEDLGFDEHGKKIHHKKVKEPKKVAMNISRGTLTVDGMTSKAALNYDIADLKYLYLYAPWIGIVVVSNEPFPNAKEQQKAFDDKNLTVTVGEHTFQVSSDKRLLGKKPQPAFVLVDRDFPLPAKLPVMGYGPIRKPPYAWPGSKQQEALKGAAPPPLPQNMLPTLLLQPCPAGQMRMAAKAALPGATAPVQPCVPILKGKPVPAAVVTPATTTASKP